jgi:hypothetical protein
VLRNIGAFFAGTIVGSIINMGLIQLNSTVLYPTPAGMDPNDMDAFIAYIASLPTPAFFVVLLAHMGQAFVGGWVAARISENHPMALAFAVAGFTALGGLANLIMLPAPTWMWFEMPLYVVAGYAAGTLELRRRA